MREMRHENICMCEDNNIKPTTTHQPTKKVNGKQKNRDMNVITFVTTSSQFFFFFIRITLFCLSPHFISFPSFQGRKTVKATNKPYRGEMTLSVKIKKKRRSKRNFE